MTKYIILEEEFSLLETNGENLRVKMRAQIQGQKKAARKKGFQFAAGTLFVVGTVSYLAYLTKTQSDIIKVVERLSDGGS